MLFYMIALIVTIPLSHSFEPTILDLNLDYGSSKATKDEVVLLTQLRFIDKLERTIASCGGALIARTIVLSAAHCFVPLTNMIENGEIRLKVYGGSVLRFGGDGFDVVRIHIHPKYNYETDLILQKGKKDALEANGGQLTEEIVNLTHLFTNNALHDLAILVLKPANGRGGFDWDQSTKFQPIAVLMDSSSTALKDLEECFLVGTGRRRPYDGILKDLKPKEILTTRAIKVELPAIDRCHSMASVAIENVYCSDGYTCELDLGSPLICQINGSPTLVGILSRGISPACMRSPQESMSTYTNITENIEWILSKISDEFGRYNPYVNPNQKDHEDLI